ncbi:hypothetical protein [Microvirga massiliensis]|uniref:hypothetical protein n=1 Tax=Microvirga massiliensis TaxID=1033741 RepID=UPI00062BE50B|nr:hypothetical protein [Microvirga massiliensis]
MKDGDAVEVSESDALKERVAFLEQALEDIEHLAERAWSTTANDRALKSIAQMARDARSPHEDR